MTKEKDKHVVVAGAGGNLCSHVVPLIGRMSEVGRVTLIDHDVYEPENLHTQDIQRSDLGKPKSVAQAQRLRRIDPSLRVDAIVDSVENVPLGRLRSDVSIAGLDSMGARQIVNAKARQLGVPYVDGGVDGDALLARVSVFYPGPESACLECGFYPSDYEIANQKNSCIPGSHGGPEDEPPATNAPASLGALAASLLAIECRRILTESPDADRTGRELLLDITGGNLYKTRLVYNPDCRVSEHRSQPINGTEACAASTTLNQLITRAASRRDGCASPGDTNHLSVVGQSMITRLTCRRCGVRRQFFRLKASLRPGRPLRCRLCGGERIATGFDTAEVVDVRSLSPRALDRSLRSIGIREGDVLRIGGSGDSARTFEINSDVSFAGTPLPERRARSTRRTVRGR